MLGGGLMMAGRKIVVFNITAGTLFDFRGYFANNGFRNLQGFGTAGSISGDASADEGIITDLGHNTNGSFNFLYVKEGSQSLSNILIDGTSYTLSFNGIFSGYDEYIFGGNTQLFFDGVTYEIKIT